MKTIATEKSMIMIFKNSIRWLVKKKISVIDFPKYPRLRKTTQ